MNKTLVLSGGGSKGAFQVGVMSVMADKGYEFDSYAGVSVGAINAAYLAHFDSFRKGAKSLELLWQNFDTPDIYKKWFLWPLSVLWKPSVYNAEPLLKMLKKELTLDYKKPCIVGAVDIETGAYGRFKQPMHDEIHASAAFPAFLNSTNGYTDGGLRNVTPVGDAIKLLKADEITVIMAQKEGMGPLVRKDGYKAYEVALRSLDVMMDEITENDIKIARLYNIQAIDYPDKGKRFVDIDVHRPQTFLDVSPLDFGPKGVKFMMEEGRKYARENILSLI